MSSTSKQDLSTELLNVIQKDVQHTDIEPYKVLYVMLRLYIQAIVKIMKLKEDENYAIGCGDLVLHVFKIMYQYTKHAKASKEMAERVIVTFQEYIYTTMSLNSIETYLAEIKEFIIDKSIGHIHLYRPFVNKYNAQSTSKYSFHTESLDLMCSFIKSLFFKLISLYKYNSSDTLKTSMTTSLFQSLRESKNEKKTIDEIPIVDIYFMDDIPEEKGDDEQYDYIDIIEEHMITVAILFHINIDKWVILGKSHLVEPIIHETVETINRFENIISKLNILKLTLECFYYGASYYSSIPEAITEITDILDEYEPEETEDELDNEYIDIRMDIKDYRPFQSRMYRIYEQKNKQV
jgi:hypothetical protein